MAVKTLFHNNDFVDILSRYDLGAYNSSEAIQQGTVQTNYFIRTKITCWHSELPYSEVCLLKTGEYQHVILIIPSA